MSLPLSIGIIFVIGCLIGSVFGFTLHALLSGGYDGRLTVDDTSEEKTSWVLQYDGDPNDIVNRKSIRFQVCVRQ